jgi:magnesium and cobalt transporter
MSEDRSGNDSGDKTWIEKIADAFSTEPKNLEDLHEILKIARQNDVIDADATSIIEGALEVSELQVREIMIPRTQMVVVKTTDEPEEILDRIIESGHSRYPVVGETTDDILGILLAKDLLPKLRHANVEELDILSMLRSATMVPESKRVNVLLKEFRENRNHMALVIDEYGGVAGLVTIEDVLEEIVGEIEDEYDKEEDSYIKQIANNDFLVKALTPIEEFNQQFESDLSEEEFDTIGGIIMQRFGHLPGRNETIEVDGFRFKVMNADSRQIHLLRMSQLTDVTEE